MRHIREGSLTLDGYGLTLGYQAWLPDGLDEIAACPEQQRILAYPGWLDNSGSFEPLAPYFAKAGFAVVALDPPGCGHSSWRSKAAMYHDFEEIPFIAKAADLVGWEGMFIAMGHSRGSNIMVTLSGVLTDRVLATILVESNLGMAGTYIHSMPQAGKNRFGRMSFTFDADRKNKSRTPKTFQTKEQFYEHNAGNTLFPKSRQIAEAIVNRHIAPVEGGFSFIHDTRTYGQAQSRFIDTWSNHKVLESIQCPVINIVASEAFIQLSLLAESVEAAVPTVAKRFNIPEKGYDLVRAYVTDVRLRCSLIKDMHVQILEGKHHLHGDIPEAVSRAILNWLKPALRRSKAGAKLPDLRTEHGELAVHRAAKHFLGGVKGDYIVDHLHTEEPVVHQAREVQCEIDDLKLAGKLWGSGPKKVLAWCDARDNAASWDYAASSLCQNHPELSILALDPPGQGHSMHPPLDYGFGISEQALLVYHIADHFKWQSFSLIGHGKGASIALFAAGIFPKRVTSVMLLDPSTTTIPVSWAPSELYYALQERNAKPPKLPTFSSIDVLAHHIASNPVFPMPTPASKLIAARRSNVNEDGLVSLSDDPRIFWTRSPLLEIQHHAFQESVTEITAPVFVLIPNASQRCSTSEQKQRLVNELSYVRSSLTVQYVDGGSHVHTASSVVVTMIEKLLKHVKIAMSYASPTHEQGSKL
mmetsp:Transcript_3949/g.7630  ORF Transcript_3949/g.7630 Transcript_3949/m.7630 type:complete len:698 (+) Transcript_3949:105-2198(+)